MAAEARGPSAYLVYTDRNGHGRTFALDPTTARVRVGRGTAAELRLAWDREVSRIHAELEQLGQGWAVIDDGLSANGTYVNGERLLGRRRLTAGDEILVGTTSMVFRTVLEDDSQTFVPGLDQPPVELSRMQRRVLIALCRPCRAEGEHGLPATNQAIADEVYVSVAGVKTHLRVLFRKFAIADLPQNRKRARLAELAFERKVVSERDLV